MTPAVCPYCRCPVDVAEREQTVCAGCGTPHHSDCYAENGGCTVFGCSAAPPDEPKLNVAAPDLSALELAGVIQTGAAIPKGPLPPPMVNGGQAPTATPFSTAGSVLFRSMPAPAAAAAPALTYLDLVPDADRKSRNTFILLGALLGMFGAHNFYAGYTNKALVQLGITVLSVGFASPMTWVWAVIDAFTVEADSSGVKFKS
ncbi:MAG TPA: NINE protein [Candidatus Angelobacter sp.]|nr:NINE protein [Candidatus Angelobacter sp.]